MFDIIRQKIRENRIAEALNDLDGLSLSREDASRLVNLHRRYRVYQDKAIGNLEEDRLLRIEENGIVEDVLVFLDTLEFAPRQVPVEEAGADAGAGKEVVKSKGGNMRWLLLLLGVLLVAVLAYQVIPKKDKTASKVPAQETPVQPTGQTSDKPNEQSTQPAGNPTGEDKPAQDENPTEPQPRDPGGKLTIDPRIVDRATLKDVTDLKINPDLLKNVASRLSLMTDGPQVPMAFAVYYDKTSTTTYNEEISRKLGGYVRSLLQREVSLEVLTNTFHQSDLRERIVLRAASDGDARLKAERTPYLLLMEISKEQGTKARMQICLFDVARQTGFPQNRQVTIRSANGSFVYTEITAFLKEFLSDMRKRGLLK